jgi:hypothetical protein
MISVALLFILIPAVFGFALEGDHCREAGCLVGANGAWLLLAGEKTDWRADPLLTRALRIILGIIAFLLSSSLFQLSLEAITEGSSPPLFDFVKYSVSGFLSILCPCRMRSGRGMPR